MNNQICIPNGKHSGDRYGTPLSPLNAGASGSTTANYEADPVFNRNVLPEVLIEVEQENWNRLLFAHDISWQSNFYIPANFTFTLQGQSLHFENIGLRIKGNTSRKRPEGFTRNLHREGAVWRRCSFTVNFGKYVKEQRFYSYKKLNLKAVREDPTYVREVYCYDLYQRYGVNVTPRCGFCKFTILVKGDQQPVYHGIYKLIEHIDKIFIRHRLETFGDAKGYLWKARYGATLLDPSPQLMGIKKREHNLYDLKTNKAELETAKETLSGFIHDLNSLKGEAFAQWIKRNMDVELFLKTYAINTLCGNWDDYWANSNNYYLYFNRKEQRFFFIPFDFENTLGTAGIDRTDSGVHNPLKWSDNKNPLVRKILLVQEFRNIYLKALYELVDPEKKLFYREHSIARIKWWRALIQDHILNDTHEDELFYDRPAFWGSQPRYRLLSRPNNYFETRAKSLPRFSSGKEKHKNNLTASYPHPFKVGMNR